MIVNSGCYEIIELQMETHFGQVFIDFNNKFNMIRNQHIPELSWKIRIDVNSPISSFNKTLIATVDCVVNNDRSWYVSGSSPELPLVPGRKIIV